MVVKVSLGRAVKAARRMLPLKVTPQPLGVVANGTAHAHHRALGTGQQTFTWITKSVT